MLILPLDKGHFITDIRTVDEKGVDESVEELVRNIYRMRLLESKVTPVRNSYEAYGFLIDKYQKILQANKDFKKDMDELLENLSASNDATLTHVNSMIVSLEEMIIAVAHMAAEALRVSEGLNESEAVVTYAD